MIKTSYEDFKLLIPNWENDKEEWKIYFQEKYDCECNLVYDSGAWMLNEFNKRLPQFDFMKMVLNDEIFGEILDFLPKDRFYRIGFQIGNDIDTYPHLLPDETCVRLIYETDKYNNLLEPTLNLTDMKPEIVDIIDSNHLYSIWNNLDGIGSGYCGVEVVSIKHNTYLNVLCDSYMILTDILDGVDVKSNLFELLKRQELKIFTNMYPEFNELADNILNVKTKNLFDKLAEQFFPHSRDEKFIDGLPDIIKLWYYNTQKTKITSKLSPSILLWREMINLDVCLSDIDSCL